MEKDVEADEFDALDDVETLPWNLAYVMVCIPDANIEWCTERLHVARL